MLYSNINSQLGSVSHMHTLSTLSTEPDGTKMPYTNTHTLKQTNNYWSYETKYLGKNPGHSLPSMSELRLHCQQQGSTALTSLPRPPPHKRANKSRQSSCCVRLIHTQSVSLHSDYLYVLSHPIYWHLSYLTHVSIHPYNHTSTSIDVFVNSHRHLSRFP